MVSFAFIDPSGRIQNTDLNLSPLQAGWTLDSALSWSAFINYSDHGRNDQSMVFNGQSDTWSPISINFQGICMGGTIHLSVRATVRDIVTGAKDNINWDGHSAILGLNPARQDVKSFLDDIRHQVIAYKESRFNQFFPQGDASYGLPKFGPPNGFGIMQLDNSPIPTSLQIWSWRENLVAGFAKYNSGVAVVQNHYNNFRATNPSLPQLTIDQLQYAVYQYYNSGNNFYWLANSANNGWVKNSPVYTDYGDDAMNIEAKVKAGSFPADW